MNLPSGKIDFSVSKERTALLLSIGISLLIWFFLKLSKDYTTTKVIYLKYEVPALMEFTETPPPHLEAIVKGNGLDLTKKFLFKRNPTISINLSEYPNHQIQRDEIILKIQKETGLIAEHINQKYLRFNIDSTATKKVPIHLDFAIDYKPDFYLREPIKLSADSVLISGSVKELSEITAIKTEQQKCESVNNHLQLKLKLKTDQYKTVKTFPKDIEVNIFVEQYTEKSIEIPVKIINAKDSVQILPTVVNIICSVGLSRYDKLGANDFVVEADFGNGIKLSDKNSVPVHIKESPEWIRSPRLLQKTVEYLIVR